jgi:hypothetical protein
MSQPIGQRAPVSVSSKPRQANRQSEVACSTLCPPTRIARQQLLPSVSCALQVAIPTSCTPRTPEVSLQRAGNDGIGSHMHGKCRDSAAGALCWRPRQVNACKTAVNTHQISWEYGPHTPGGAGSHGRCVC